MTDTKDTIHNIYISAEESVAWKELAARFCIMQSDGADAFQMGDKNVLASLIALSGRLCPEQTTQHIRTLIDGIPHQPKSNGRGSNITLSGKNLEIWNSIALSMEFPHYQKPHAAQLARRIAVAYARDPDQAQQHIEAILDLVDQPSDLTALYAEALNTMQIKNLIQTINADLVPTERPSRKGWQPSPVVPHRTLAMLLLCLLTGLRGQSLLQLRFRHIQTRGDGTFIVATPDHDERTYVVYDRRFHSAFKGYLDSIGRHTTYHQLDAGQAPDPDDFMWQSDPERSDAPTTQAFPKWGFLKPLMRYANGAAIPAINYTKLLATYASLLRQHLSDPLDVRCNLVPMGERTTDVELILP